jgi:ABC-type cobalt transport system, ATPase component
MASRIGSNIIGDNMITIKDLSFHYDNEDTLMNTNVLNKINLTIQDGEFIAVLGHNGCGKSTLAKLLNAILIPSEGDVLIGDMNTKDEDLLIDIRQTVGMVFQNPDNQIVATIVEDDVAFAPENLGVPSPEIRERVDWALKSVGMYDFRKRAPHTLSGGQKQRVAIAGILAMMPKCIVLDEPTAMLDPVGRQEVMKTIKMLNQKYHMTVVLITHYMDEAALADRVVVMQKGNIVMDDTPTLVFTKVDTMRSIGLDVPQVTELMYELKKMNFPIKTDILNVDDCVFHLLKILSA